MDHFHYQGETLFAESVSVATLAGTYGTLLRLLPQRSSVTCVPIRKRCPESLVWYVRSESQLNLAVLNVLRGWAPGLT